MSLNDPQWGKRGGGGNNAGPPDLDEIWRNVNRRLSDLFGRRGGGGNADVVARWAIQMENSISISSASVFPVLVIAF